MILNNIWKCFTDCMVNILNNILDAIVWGKVLMCTLQYCESEHTASSWSSQNLQK